MIDKYSLKKLLPVLILLFIICTLKHKSIFCLGNAMMAMPFFYFGHYFCRNIHEFVETQSICHKLFYSVALFVLTIWLTHINGKVSMWGVSYGSKWSLPVSFTLFHVNALCGSFMLLFVCSFIHKSSTLIVYLANSLITILGFQLFFIYFSWYDFPVLTTPIMGLFISVLFILGCYIVHCVIIKYIPFIIGK